MIKLNCVVSLMSRVVGSWSLGRDQSKDWRKRASVKWNIRMATRYPGHMRRPLPNASITVASPGVPSFGGGNFCITNKPGHQRHDQALATCAKQCPGEIFGQNRSRSMCFQVQPATCWHLSVSLHWSWGTFSKMIGNIPEVWNFHQLFLKLKFICNQRSVLPVHRIGSSKIKHGQVVITRFSNVTKRYHKVL